MLQDYHICDISLLNIFLRIHYLKNLVVWEARQLNPLPEVNGEVGEQLVGGAAGGQDQAEEEKGR